jgi:hypothetical protein
VKLSNVGGDMHMFVTPGCLSFYRKVNGLEAWFVLATVSYGEALVLRSSNRSIEWVYRQVDYDELVIGETTCML